MMISGCDAGLASLIVAKEAGDLTMQVKLD
jgi:hypothetical protein